MSVSVSLPTELKMKTLQDICQFAVKTENNEIGKTLAKLVSLLGNMEIGDFKENVKHENKKDKEIEEFMDKLLSCPICLGILCDPITISCGHTFCRSCYDTATFRSTDECALCRTKPLLKSSNYKCNSLITKITTHFFGSIMKERKLEQDKIMKELEFIKPVFCLQYPVFPGQKLTLNLFEQRYIKMIQHSLSRDGKFIYLCPDLNGPRRINYNNLEDNEKLIPNINDIGSILKIINFKVNENAVHVDTIVESRVILNDCFFVNSVKQVCFAKYEYFNDDLTEVNKILNEKKQNKNLCCNNETRNDDDDYEDDDDYDDDSDDSDDDEKNEIEEMQTLFDDFIENVESFDFNVYKSIENNCGKSVELESDYSNISQYSYYIASLVYSVYLLFKSKLHDVNIDNEWLYDIYSLQDPITRLWKIHRIVKSSKKWFQI